MEVFLSKFQYLTIILISVIAGYLFGLSAFDYFFWLYVSFFVFTIIRISAFIGAENHKTKYYILLKQIYLTLSLSLLIHFVIYKIKNNVNQKNGDRIVRIIEKYKIDNKEYPKSLYDLIPKYINKYPEYRYNHQKDKMLYMKSGNEYILEYLIDGENINTYTSEYKKWRVTD